MLVGSRQSVREEFPFYFEMHAYIARVGYDTEGVKHVQTLSSVLICEH